MLVRTWRAKRGRPLLDAEKPAHLYDTISTEASSETVAESLGQSSRRIVPEICLHRRSCEHGIAKIGPSGNNIVVRLIFEKTYNTYPSRENPAYRMVRQSNGPSISFGMIEKSISVVDWGVI